MNSDLFSNYASPLSWRYGSDEMRQLFSEQNKYKLWRQIWVSLAKAQHQAGLISKKELTDLQKNQHNLNIEKILDIEKQVKHDVVSAIKEFSAKAKVGGGKIHLGATSMDIVDNADSIRIKQALTITEKNLTELLQAFSQKITQYASLPCLGHTHLQPAEPTTVGYRFAFYAQDLLINYQLLKFTQKTIKAKGLKGAVGTSASFKKILTGTKTSPQKLESLVMKDLGLEPSLVSTQVYTRQYDYLVLSTLSAIGASLYKFAADLRLLQNPSIGEWSEPFGSKQVGSSAMPFKKNPISSEKICSLARYLSKLPSVAWDNSAHSYLERTLDDSANRRILTPQAFLLTDEILKVSHKLISSIVINKIRIKHNLNLYAPFAATESIIIEAVKKGADRQKMHEILRKLSLKAWNQVHQGNPNPLPNLLLSDKSIKKYLTSQQITDILKVEKHVGDAAIRAKKLTQKIKSLK